MSVISEKVKFVCFIYIPSQKVDLFKKKHEKGLVYKDIANIEALHLKTDL